MLTYRDNKLHCFVTLRVWGSRWGETVGISSSLLGGEPTSAVPLYCTRILSITALSGTPLLQDAKSATDESRSLRTRIHLAEAAQKQARGMEMDYEEVIHLLEAEIAELKCQRAEQPGQVRRFEIYTFHVVAQIRARFSLSRVPLKVGQCLLCIIQ